MRWSDFFRLYDPPTWWADPLWIGPLVFVGLLSVVTIGCWVGRRVWLWHGRKRRVQRQARREKRWNEILEREDRKHRAALDEDTQVMERFRGFPTSDPIDLDPPKE